MEGTHTEKAPLVASPHQAGRGVYSRWGLTMPCARELFEIWWGVTTSPEYLESILSRRSLTWSVGTLCFSVGILLDISRGESRNTVCIDSLGFCFMVLLYKVAKSSLLFDWYFSLICFSNSLLYDLFTRDPHALANSISIILMLMIAGVHSTALAIFFILSWICSFAALRSDCTVEFFLIGIAAMLWCIILEYQSALMFRQQQQNKRALGCLLDHATDGFCEIAIETGIISNASSKLELTLTGDVCLQGVPFKTFLNSFDDQVSFEQLLHVTSNTNQLRPILVSCRGPQNTEFDGRLIPYSSSSNSLTLCLQIIGESRAIMKQSQIHAVTMRKDPLDSFDCSASDATSVFKELCDSIKKETVASIVEQSEKSLSSLAYSHSSNENPIGKNVALLSPIIENGPCAKMERLDVGTQTESSRTIPPRLPGRLDRNRSARKSRRPVCLKTKRRLLSQFVETPKFVVTSLLHDTLAKINTRGKGCCQWHISLYALQDMIFDLLPLECNTTWKPYSDWQCKTCFTLQQSEESDENGEPGGSTRSCEFCYTQYSEDQASVIGIDAEESYCEADVESARNAVESD